MAILCGVDEVGYGSKLGPLIVTLAAVETPDVNINLWDILSRVVDKKSRKKLSVWDSKRVYNGSIASLEPTSLAFLALVRKVSVFSDLNKYELPWYREDISIPFERPVAEELINNLKDCLASQGIRFLTIDSTVIEPHDFNRGVKSNGNKHLLLFKTINEMVNKILVLYKDSKYCFRIGRLGGRKFYLPQLIKSFKGGVLIKQENDRISEYEIKNGSSSADLSFITDGDSSDFLMGLASIVGKYTRECSMRLFNNYWNEKFGIKSTSGYGKDATRFFRDIEPFFKKLLFKKEEILRSR